MLEEKGRRKPHHFSGLNLVTYDRKGYPVETDLGRICGVLLVASTILMLKGSGLPTTPLVSTRHSYTIFQAPQLPSVKKDAGENEWMQLPAVVRIKRIIAKNYPKDFTSEKVLQELQLGVAQLVCEEVSSDTDYKKLAATVSFYQPDELITDLERKRESLEENEKNSIWLIARYEAFDGRILINNYQLEQTLKRSKNLGISENSLGNSDEMIVKVNALLREYLLQVQKDEIVENFSPLEILTIGRTGEKMGNRIMVHKLQGYNFYLQKDDEKAYLQVGGEIAEAAARIIASKNGIPYILPNFFYEAGANMVSWVNTLVADMSTDEFLQNYVSVNGLMNRWNQRQARDRELQIGPYMLSRIGIRTKIPWLQPRKDYDPIQEEILEKLAL
ncbi:MAG: hypothetical protein A3F31_01095 [Candidatus Levybacteria bacterium RIFCSPHIGHO2_12_FULL_38_12]|nr:MAG: hypothetical protein A3F31_01095 [Candidatus Levybacteria bacterium RIFCSPHIGHO2_12_FULL_38_12]